MSAVAARSTALVSTSGTSDCAGCFIFGYPGFTFASQKPGVTRFINDAISFQFPQLVQHFFTTDIRLAQPVLPTWLSPLLSVRQKQSPLKFPPGKNHFSTQTKPAVFRRSYSCFSNSIGVGPDGRLGAASCRRTGGMLRPLPTCLPISSVAVLQAVLTPLRSSGAQSPLNAYSRQM